VIREKSRQGGAKARPVWIFLYSENFFPQAALAPPNEKNQNVLSALTNHHYHALACYFVLQSNAYQKECVSILKIHIAVIALQFPASGKSINGISAKLAGAFTTPVRLRQG